VADQVITIRHSDGTIVVSTPEVGALLVRRDSPGLAERLLFALADRRLYEEANAEDDSKVRVFIRAEHQAGYVQALQHIAPVLNEHLRFSFLQKPEQLRGTRNPLVWRAPGWFCHPNEGALSDAERERESCRWTPP
jgi:hypothetical protein